MYGLEDAFEHFCGHRRIHWMWWPAIGGIGIGVGGFFFPRGLGVGYDNIAELLRGNTAISLIVGIILAKSLMWAFSLSSGTSGGVLAPLLMIGAALGESAARLAHLLRRHPGPLGAHGHGRNARRRTRRSPHRGPVFTRAHPRSAGAAPARARMHSFLSRHGTRHAPLYPY